MIVSQISVLDFWSRFDESRNCTLEQVAKGTGISQGTIRNLRSRKMLPNLCDTVVIADFLGVSLDWLVLGKISNDRDSKISRVIRAYLDADIVSQIAVDRVLRLD